MVATLRQEKAADVGAAGLTFAATFDSACLGSGESVIVWVTASDGNAGTVTQPSDTPNLPIALKSNDVSLCLAWGIADGGETTISGTVSSNTAGGRVWILEITDPDGENAWARRATITIFTASGGATNADATITATPAATEAGFGIAAAAWDAVATAGTASWSNSWVKDFDGSAGTPVGLWTATKAAIAEGATESTTLTRSGGTAEQYQALLVVFGREARTPGVLAGTAPRATGALAAALIDPAAAAGASPRATAALAAALVDPATAAGSAPQATAALAAAVRNTAVFAGASPRPVGAVAAAVAQSGVLAGSAPHARARLTNLVVTYPLVGGLTGAALGAGPHAGVTPSVSTAGPTGGPDPTLPDAGPHAGEAAVLTP